MTNSKCPKNPQIPQPNAVGLSQMTLLMFRFQDTALASKMTVRHSDQLHRGLQIPFVPGHEGNVALFRGPSVWSCLALGKNLSLVLFGQPNIAMPMSMNVHEHRPSDEKGVFVDSGILSFRHTG